MTVGIGGVFRGVCGGGGVLLFFKANIQEEHLLMPTSGVLFSNENFRSFALSAPRTTRSTKCMWLSLFARFVEILPFLLCEPWLRC